MIEFVAGVAEQILFFEPEQTAEEWSLKSVVTASGEAVELRDTTNEVLELPVALDPVPGLPAFSSPPIKIADTGKYFLVYTGGGRDVLDSLLVIPGAVSTDTSGALSTVTATDLRTYANLPEDVPESFLNSHLAAAIRDVTSDTDTDEAPEGKEGEWVEAQIVRALASCFPHLHTFALDGAAKVGRLVDGAVDFRFLGAREIKERVAALNSRCEDLVEVLKGSQPPFDMLAI